MDIKTLAQDIHKVAVSKGFWDIPRTIPELVCLVHSELDEAFEAYNNNDFNGFTEELADVIIRLLDIMEGLDYHIPDSYTIEIVDYGILNLDMEIYYTPLYNMAWIYKFLLMSHLDLTKCLELYRGKKDKEISSYLVQVLFRIWHLGSQINLEEAIQRKNEFNKTRPYKHGGKRL